MRQIKVVVLMVVAMLLMLPTIATAQNSMWHVDVMPAIDSEIHQVMDTATVEPAMCLGVDVDTATYRIVVWQMLPATEIGKRQTRDMTTFGCPQGAAMAHGHFLARGHEDGPSDVDLQAIKNLPSNVRPPVAIIIVANRMRDIHYVPYDVK